MSTPNAVETNVPSRGAISELDALYKPFSPFIEWSTCSLNQGRWTGYVERLDKFKGAAKDQLRRARDHVKLAAAIESGAIEGLYPADRGFTLSVTADVSIFQAALSKRDAHTRSMIAGQVAAYDYILDLATQKAPITEATLRELHHVICENQGTYYVETPQGRQEQLLPVGQYKSYPNHVIQTDGRVHAYAPVLVPFQLFNG